MTRTITFYGAGLDPYGMPIPYHRYLIMDGPAPWVGVNATVASITLLATGSPMPAQTHFTVANPTTAGEAIDTAVAAIAALPQNHGLTKI